MATILKEPPMTEAEHTAIYQTISESVVAEPEPTVGDEIDPRVRCGVELLDREHPGWADKIDLRRFNLQDGTNCVIGQVYGDYLHVNEIFGIEEDDDEDEYGNREVDRVAAEYGFYVAEPDWAEDDWSVLEDDWRTVIAARQS